MEKYHKINTVFKRDMKSSDKRLILNEWSDPDFEYLKDNMWEFSEKIDGTNIRIGRDGVNVLFGGRTDNAIIPSHLLEYLKETFAKEIMHAMFEDCDDVCLYGEGYGHKIQKGGNYLGDDVGFILFDIKIGRYWLQTESTLSIADDMGIAHVPILGNGTIQDAIDMVSVGFKSTIAENKDYMAEGLILKPKVGLLSRNGRGVITKIKTSDFKHLK